MPTDYAVRAAGVARTVLWLSFLCVVVAPQARAEELFWDVGFACDRVELVPDARAREQATAVCNAAQVALRDTHVLFPEDRLSDRYTTAVVGGRPPTLSFRSVYATPEILGRTRDAKNAPVTSAILGAHIRGRLSADLRALSLSFRSVYTTPEILGRLVLAIDQKLRDDVQVVDLDLPGLAPAPCGGGPEPGLSHLLIKRSYTLRFNGAMPGKAAGLCSEKHDADRPLFMFRSIQFEGSLRLALPRRVPLSLQLVASTVKGSLDILESGSLEPVHAREWEPEIEASDARPVEIDPSLTGLLVVSNSRFESGFQIYDLQFTGIDVRFSTFRTLAFNTLRVSSKFLIRDNEIASLRFNRMRLPQNARVDSNRINDSFLIEELEMYARGPGADDEPFRIVHNQIEGNFQLLLGWDVDDRVADEPALVGDGDPCRTATAEPVTLQMHGLRVKGSAYYDLRAPGGPGDGGAWCVTEGPRLGFPLFLDLSDTTVDTRLVASLVGRPERLEGGMRVRATNRLDVASAKVPALAFGPQAVSVKLANVAVGTLSWNLPAREGVGREGQPFVWYGADLRFQHFEPDCGKGPVPRCGGSSPATPSTTLSRIAERERHQPDELETFLSAYVGASPEPHERIEAYLRGRGFLFAPQVMRAEKFRENIYFEEGEEGLIQRWSRDGPLALVRAGLAAALPGSAGASAMPGGSGGDVGGDMHAGAEKGRASVSAMEQLALVAAYGWGWPARHGESPGQALVIWLVVFGTGAMAYWWHSRRWSDGWTPGPSNGDNPPFHAVAPGFIQRDAHPWRTFHPLTYSLDCMIPIVDLELKKEYRVYAQGRGGRLVACFPFLQTFAGWWLGTLLIGLLFT